MEFEQISIPRSRWSTVTPFSKYAAMALFVAMPFMGMWVGYAYAPTQVVEVEKIVTKVVPGPMQVPDSTVATSSADPVVSPPSLDESIFTFKGYYRSEERTIFSPPEQCNQLVVQPPTNALAEYFLDLVHSGNTVNQSDSQGRLALNLPWSDIPVEDQKQILRSTESSPISVRLVKKGKETPAEVGPCYSFVQYIGLKDSPRPTGTGAKETF